jgi:alcohol dehydrogenase, propanol-preferring
MSKASRTWPTATTAWIVDHNAAAEDHPLCLVERPLDKVGPSGLLLEVTACGVCRTDLHLAEGDLVPHVPGCTPGHEIVGRVLHTGPHVTDFAPGERVGAAWLASTCGQCRYCRAGQENLCPASRYTGWDIHGGFARHVVVDARFAYHLPEGPPDEELAPLLCAGIIGYRALERSQLPPGGRLGLYGFGASAHLTAQLALGRGAVVHVLTRAEEARQLALELGAASVAGAYDVPPEPLDAAILFAPVGDLVPVALSALDRGGTLVVAGIHLSDIPSLNYQRHLFQERSMRSITANTRADGLAYLAETARNRPTVHVQSYAMDRAPNALADLAADRITGVAVLTP